MLAGLARWRSKVGVDARRTGEGLGASVVGEEGRRLWCGRQHRSNLLRLKMAKHVDIEVVISAGGG